jgi:NTP pyrophosphatase (non-canonical NTP hydrolase)
MNKQTLTQKFLDKLQEEASEVIQAVSKIRRFGPDNHHPDRQQTNKQEFVGELEDFLALLGALEHLEYLDLTKSPPSIAKKLQALFHEDQQ